MRRPCLAGMIVRAAHRVKHNIAMVVNWCVSEAFIRSKTIDFVVMGSDHPTFKKPIKAWY